MFDHFLIDKSFLHDGSLVIAALIMLAAALSDFKKLKISNKLCLALVAMFPFYALTADGDVAWLQHLAVAGVVFSVGFALYTLGMLGGGDVKMLAAAALWAGPKLIATLLIYTTLAGGVLALAFAGAALLRALLNARRNTQESLQEMPWHKAPVPYGMAIACGGISALVMLAQSTVT